MKKIGQGNGEKYFVKNTLCNKPQTQRLEGNMPLFNCDWMMGLRAYFFLAFLHFSLPFKFSIMNDVLLL